MRPGGPNAFGDAPEGRFDPEGPDIAPPGIAPSDGEDPNDFVAPRGPAFSAPEESATGEDPASDGPDPESRVLFTSGDDAADSAFGDDSRAGGDGNDTLAGDAGDSMIKSTGGDDTLYGGKGDDKISGDALKDLRDGSRGGHDLIKGDGDGPLGPGGERKSVSVSPNLRVPTSGSGGGVEDVGSNPNAFTVSTLAVSGLSGDISDLDLTLNLPHTASGDLRITLISPKGTAVDVAVFPPSSVVPGSLYANVTFDDDGGGVPVLSAKPGDTNLLPANPLSTFDGEDTIAALEKVVDVTEEGDDVVITRTDGKGTIRIEGIAEAGEFDSVQDLADATKLEINA